MADEKNIVPEDNSEEIKTNEKKKPDKKLIIGIVAAVAVIAIVVGIIAGVSSGSKEKYTEKPVSTTAAASQGDSSKPGIVNGELTPATTEGGNSSSGDRSGNSSNSGSSGDSGNSSSGDNSGSNSDDKKETATKAVPVNRKLHIEITMPNDGSNDDVLFVFVNGEQLDLSGGSRDDYGYPVKTDGSVFSFDTENEYKGSVTVEASLQKYGKSASRVSGINDTNIKISLPLNHSEEGYMEID